VISLSQIKIRPQASNTSRQNIALQVGRRRLGQRDPEFIGANRAERTLIGDYELVVFDLPADRAGPAVISWELFGPPRHQELIAHGEAQTFEDAKLAAERAFDKL
jgi:hypothetical protein